MSGKYEPSYIRTLKKGGFEEKIKKAYELAQSCRLCARDCRIDRLKGGLGYCRLGTEPCISNYGPHFGEEAPISGINGSGTIFLAYCNIRCVFCQNYDIAITGSGRKYSVSELAEIIIKTKIMGCHNINFVTPTHQMPMILEAIKIAVENGLDIPIVWNCGGYESAEALEILDGIVDVYMPDFKFWDPEPARKYLDAPDYPDIARAAIKEMHRQAGDLILDDNDIAYRGLLVRHLIMPENLAGTDKLVRWLATEISSNTYINIMDQYHPCYNAVKYEEINRSLNSLEYKKAIKWARQAGLRIDGDALQRRNSWVI